MHGPIMGFHCVNNTIECSESPLGPLKTVIYDTAHRIDG